jgi:hypothetical protein
MSDRPYADLLIGAAFSSDMETFVVAGGRVPGAGGTLFIERSPDKSLPPPYDLRCDPGNLGINPKAAPHTDATAFLEASEGLGGTIALRDADGSAEIAVEPLGSELEDMPSGWTARRGAVSGIQVSVLGLLMAPTGGYKFRLEKAVPLGINKHILLLNLHVQRPNGSVTQVITPTVLSFHEREADYITGVQIAGTRTVSLPIEDPH